MKTKTGDQWRAASDRRNILSRSRLSAGSIANRKSKIVNELAFTLVELLVVIAIIAVIAAFLFPLAGVVKREAYLHATKSEMAQIETAIARYHSVYGFYPPDNPRVRGNLAAALTNQLYYELTGTRQTNNGNTRYYVTLAGNSTISTNEVNKVFGVSGFMNCSKPGADESAPSAQDFLPDLKPSQIGVLSSNTTSTVDLLAASVGGPAGVYNPVGTLGLNPWRYLSPGTNNPDSYDLWVQLVIGSKTNLVCNWNNQVQINNKTLP